MATNNDDLLREIIIASTDNNVLSEGIQKLTADTPIYGMETGSDEHKTMIDALKRIKKTNPGLYKKIINLD